MTWKVSCKLNYPRQAVWRATQETEEAQVSATVPQDKGASSLSRQQARLDPEVGQVINAEVKAVASRSRTGHARLLQLTRGERQSSSMHIIT